MNLSDRDLARALADRMERINAEGVRLTDEAKRVDTQLNAIRAEVDKLRQEYMDLSRLHQRYSNGAKVSAPPPPTKRMGPTDFIMSTLGTTGEMKKRDLIALLARAIEAQQIATQTKDPQKLASSLVGNLAKRDRLIISPEGMVTLPQKER